MARDARMADSRRSKASKAKGGARRSPYRIDPVRQFPYWMNPDDEKKRPLLPGTKVCCACGSPLPILGHFAKNGGGRFRSRCRACDRARRARDRAIRRRRESVCGSSPVTDWHILELKIRQNYRCACGCGASIVYSYHVDHITPIAKGGKHVYSNIQLLTPKCNLMKGAK